MQINYFKKANLYFTCLAIILINACTTVKNYPINKPFVYSNKIVLNAALSKDQKLQLTKELEYRWGDSMQVRKVKKLAVITEIKNPPVFDTINFARSIKFMDDYLKSQGYYYATFKTDSSAYAYKKQQRVTPIIKIDVGKIIAIDSFAINLDDSNLQKLAVQNFDKSLLQKGTPFTKQNISNELDRITALFKRNGYYNFSRDDIYALIDTTDSKYLNLTVDPFELAKLLDEYSKSKKENPKWDVTIRQRKDTTGNNAKQFFISHIYYYPQAGSFDITDSVILANWLHHHQFSNYHILFDRELIKINPLITHTFIKPGDLYNNTNFYKSINSLTKLGPWKQVDAKIVRQGSDSLEVHITLTPDKKQGIEINNEISKNTGDLTAGNLLGLSFGITYRNRNVWKQAIQSSTSGRVGLEFNPGDSSKALQTFFATLGHTYSFPKMIGEPLGKWVIKNIVPFKGLRNTLNSIVNLPDKRSLLSANYSYSNRFDLFNLKSINISFGYEFKTEDKLWLYKPINVELYGLEKKKGLDDLIKSNPFLQLSFNTGNIIGQTFSFSKQYINKKNPNRLHLFRIGVEESGLFTGMIKSLQKNIYRYGKFEVEYIDKTTLPKGEFAYKFFVGMGYNYSKSSDIGKVLPFYKQFFVGGPNSMRAWGLRQLGQGSSLLYDTSTSSFRDRFGDMRLEANVEYRFNIYNGSFLRIGSALFADFGNVWNLKRDNDNLNSEFSFERLGKDLAIGIGTGLRFSLGTYVTIRLDVGYKLKDPARQYNNGWVDLQNAAFKEKRVNGVEVRNTAFQLGIGLPF